MTDSPFNFSKNMMNPINLFFNQTMIIIIQVIQIIIDTVQFFHKRYKKSQTNIRNQVLKNMNELVIQCGNDCSEREYGIIVPIQGNK